MSKVQITQKMLDQLEYNVQGISLKCTETPVNEPQDITSPTVMFIFAESDLNAAGYHLGKSWKSGNAIVTLIVQESVRENFLSIAKSQLKTFDSNVKRSPKFIQSLNQIAKLNVETISAPNADITNSPVLVADITHEQLGPSIANGIVTVHTFRTAKEAIALCSKESVNFVNANIWNENHSCAYELVDALQCRTYYINCYDVSLEPLKDHIKEDGNFVTIRKSYHYETLKLNGIQKSVVFPIGTIFAN